MTAAQDFQLKRDPFGKLLLTTADGVTHAAVIPVRAFPIGAPDQGIALVSADGRELAWIERLTDLPAAARTLLEEELASREFIPEIRRIRHVSGFATPSTWEVDTERGATSFILKSEDDIRRLASPALLIADSHGIHYLIRDRYALDAASRKVLDRFL